MGWFPFGLIIVYCIVLNMWQALFCNLCAAVNHREMANCAQSSSA